MSTENMLIARVCHDLITPLNAINLGLDAFEASRDYELLAMVEDSVRKANTLVQFFRELSSEHADSFLYSRVSLHKSISDLLKFYKISFELKSNAEQIANVTGKIVMYLAMVLKESMPYGGDASVQIDNETIAARCVGKNLVVPENDADQEVTYKNVIRHMLIQILKKSGFKLTATSDGDDVIFFVAKR